MLLQGVTSWFVFYLIKEKGVADAAQAAMRVSGLELGGLFGSLIAGRLSDLLINRDKSQGGKGGNVGKRVQVCMPLVMCPVSISCSMSMQQCIFLMRSALPLPCLATCARHQNIAYCMT